MTHSVRVGAENYVERLWMFLDASMSASTHSSILLATLQDFGSRIDKIYSLTNKGCTAMWPKRKSTRASCIPTCWRVRSLRTFEE